MQVSSQLHAPATLSSEEKIRDIYWKEGWVGLRVGLDGFGENKYIFPLPEIEARNVHYVDFSLYWLPCLGYTVYEINCFYSVTKSNTL